MNNEQRFEDLKDFEPTDDKDDIIMNHEFHELHELNNEQRFEDLKDFEPTDDKDDIIMNHELHYLLICYAQCSIIIIEITAKIMIITLIRFPTNVLTGHIISNLSIQIISNY